jgi:hypothetical protein
MEILKNSNNLNIVVNGEQNFRTDLGWQDNLVQFEDEILKDIINPSKNYETVRYIHKPYNKTISGVTMSQTDIWFQFYFVSGSSYVLDYNPVGISTQENELMTKQATESFFRLEFYKTPGTITDHVLTCEPPTRQNRRLINSKNLALPLGEKYFHTGNNYGYYIHVPIFTGSNYRNKENMYLFWFDDESVLTDTNLSGTTTLDKYSFTATTVQTILFMNQNNEITQVNIPIGTSSLIGWTGQTFNYPNLSYEIINNPNDKPEQKTPFYHGMNTFFMTAKFFNADRGEILDFTNSGQTTNYIITEEKDMYYQIDFDNFERTYEIYRYTGTTKLDRVGTGSTGNTCIKFYEKGGGLIPPTPTPTPTPIGAVTATPTSTPTPFPTLIPGPSPTPTETGIPIIPATATPTPTSTATLDPSAATPTPTPTPGGSPATSTPTPTGLPITSTPTPTPTPLPYSTTGSTNAGYSNNGYATGTLTVNAGHSVKVTLNVFGGTTSGGSNSGIVTGDINLSATSPAYSVNSTQNTTLGEGVYDFIITSSFDNGKYAYINFTIIT